MYFWCDFTPNVDAVRFHLRPNRFIYQLHILAVCKAYIFGMLDIQHIFSNKIGPQTWGPEIVGAHIVQSQLTRSARASHKSWPGRCVCWCTCWACVFRRFQFQNYVESICDCILCVARVHNFRVGFYVLCALFGPIGDAQDHTNMLSSVSEKAIIAHKYLFQYFPRAYALYM